MSNETVTASACWSCADEAAGKARCERWCCLPGKCLSTYPESTWPRFVEMRFPSRDSTFQHHRDRDGLEKLLKINGVQFLTSHDGTVSIERSDLPKLMRGLEGILRALAPHVPPSAKDRAQ